MIPRHMGPALDRWVNEGLPAPSEMGSFFRAVLADKFTAAVMMACGENRDALYDWALHLHNEVPGPCHGSEERLATWHSHQGLAGYTQWTIAEIARRNRDEAAE